VTNNKTSNVLPPAGVWRMIPTKLITVILTDP